MFQYGDGLFKVADGRVTYTRVDITIAFARKTGSAIISAFKGKGGSLVDWGNHATQWIFGACAMHEIGVEA